MDFNTPLFTTYQRKDKSGFRSGKPIYFQNGKIFKEKPKEGAYAELKHGVSNHSGMVQIGPRTGLSLTSGDYGTLANAAGPDTGLWTKNTWNPSGEKFGNEQFKWFQLWGTEAADPSRVPDAPRAASNVEGLMKNIGKHVSVQVPVQNAENASVRNFNLFSDPDSGELVGKFIEEEGAVAKHDASK